MHAIVLLGPETHSPVDAEGFKVDQGPDFWKDEEFSDCDLCR